MIEQHVTSYLVRAAYEMVEAVNEMIAQGWYVKTIIPFKDHYPNSDLYHFVVIFEKYPQEGAL